MSQGVSLVPFFPYIDTKNVSIDIVLYFCFLMSNKMRLNVQINGETTKYLLAYV